MADAPEKEKAPAPQPDAPGAGPAQPEATAESLAAEAEDFCAALEKFFRRGFGDMPNSADLAEIRAQQAGVRDLVRRASESGAGAGRQLAGLTQERDQFKDAAARAKADFLNYQDRARKDLQRAEEQALRGYMNDLLPILDSMDLSLKDAQSDNANLDTVRQALGMISESLNQMLKVRGLERVASTGKPYDPNQHEAVHTRPADPKQDEKPGTVVEEFRPGYLWKGLVLRPAQVVVTQAEGKK
ncbi:MAG: nucleotide exchange factor GrpE [Planctomycetota bacterium]|nr:nucleotide exchange factor GrpE [Planctomycetota bacterium]